MKVALALLLCAAATAAAPASAFAAGDGMTHRVTISAEMVNDWTVEGNRDCTPVGNGRLTVKLSTTVATRVRPYRDNDAGRAWNVAVPYGRNLREMLPARSTAAITRVDDTTPRPPADPESSPCRPLRKTGCGTTLAKRATANLRGFDRRRVWAQLDSRFTGSLPCLIGDAESWVGPERLLGGHREGQLLLKMPQPSALKRRVVRVTAQTKQKSAYGNADEGRSTNDITRKVTVTFRRL